jgi:hypothetical protein
MIKGTLPDAPIQNPTIWGGATPRWTPLLALASSHWGAKNPHRQPSASEASWRI